jgi:hypothetical protein
VPGIEGHASFGIAVNQSTDHVYVGNISEKKIFNFDSNGSPDPLLPKIDTGALEPIVLAVDNSGGPFSGYIYATGLEGPGGARLDAIRQFTPSGAVTSWQPDVSSIPPDGTPQGPGRPDIVNTGEFGPRSVAADSSGNVFIKFRNTGVINEFSPTGTFIAQAGPADLEIEQFTVDSSGNIWVGSHRGLYKLNALGSCADGTEVVEGVERCVTVSTVAFEGLAIDSNGNILAGATSPNPEILEFDSTGAQVSSSGSETLVHGVSSLAIDEASGRLYALTGPREIVQIYGPIFILPDATTQAATSVTDHSATLNGLVGADGGLESTCVFQYTDQASFKANGFQGAKTAPCEPTGPFTDEADTLVHADVALTGGTTYHFRLLATNENGSNPGGDETLTTPGPSVDSESFSEITESAAKLEGLIDPNGAETTYRFQYVTQAAFEASGYQDAEETPLGGEAIGAGTEDVEVAQQIKGLSPNTAYRFRILAESTAGASEGPDKVFTTYPSFSGLPDGRAYEQATPVEKNGANANGVEALLKSSPDGSAVSYFMTGGGAIGEGGQDFPTYVAAREGGGSWQSHAFLPTSTFGEHAHVTGWSGDLSHDYVLTWSSGTTATLYRQEVATGAMEEMASGLEAGTNDSTFFVAESDDGSEVLIESKNALVPGAPEGVSGLYLWNESSGLSLVSVLPNESAAGNGAFAGPYYWFYPNPDTSKGGPGPGYYTQDSHVLSTDGSVAFFTTSGDAQIYARTNLGTPGVTTDKVSATQKTNGSGPGGADPGGEKPAAFLEATPDGSKVFFLSSSELTNDATTGISREGHDLYLYDTESDQLIDLAPDPGDPNGADVMGMLGASEDGSYVYFAANGALAPGTSLGDCSPKLQQGSCNIYLWHEGQIRFVARVNGTIPGGGLNWSPTNSLAAKTSRVAPDGRTLSFVTTRSLTTYDSKGFSEVYRFNTEEGLQCVSCNPSLIPPRGAAAIQDIDPGAVKPIPPSPFLVENLSGDGSRLFFESPDKLGAEDSNGGAGCKAPPKGTYSCQDVYEWEANGSGSCHSSSENGGCIYLISSGESASPSFFAGASDSGDDVFFFTNQQLVGQDRDQLYDVYDARVGGTPQNPPPPNPCQGEAACRPALSPSPTTDSPGSAAFSGPGDPRPARHAKKHRHKHKKKAHKKSRKHSNRRAGR